VATAVQAVLEEQDSGTVRADDGTGSRCTDQPDAPRAEAVAPGHAGEKASATPATTAPIPSRLFGPTPLAMPSAVIGNLHQLYGRPKRRSTRAR